jgi:hypothetical protein
MIMLYFLTRYTIKRVPCCRISPGCASIHSWNIISELAMCREQRNKVVCRKYSPVLLYSWNRSGGKCAVYICSWYVNDCKICQFRSQTRYELKKIHKVHVKITVLLSPLETEAFLLAVNLPLGIWLLWFCQAYLATCTDELASQVHRHWDERTYCNGFAQSVSRQWLGKHGQRVSVDECYCALLGNSTPMKTLTRNHVTCSLLSSLCNSRTVLAVRGPCGGYI